jgi:hypothetical protein
MGSPRVMNFTVMGCSNVYGSFTDFGGGLGSTSAPAETE